LTFFNTFYAAVLDFGAKLLLYTANWKEWRPGMKKALLAAVVAAFIAAVALAQTKPITISNVVTKNFDGVATSTFRRGEMMVVEGQITYGTTYYYYYAGPASLNYLELVTLWYRNTMFNLMLRRDSIAPGQTKTVGGGIATRPGDPTGTYTFKIMIWNGFPSEMTSGWASLADPATATVTVNP
jgi:hypothetical protein